MSQDNSRGLNQPISLSQDLSGTLERANVIALQGRIFSSSAPSDQQVVTWNAGSNSWNPSDYNSNIVNVAILSSNTSYTIGANDQCIAVTTTSSGANLLFPASSPTGRIIIIANPGGTTVTITPHAGTTIKANGVNITGTVIGAIFICYDGVNWFRCQGG